MKTFLKNSESLIEKMPVGVGVATLDGDILVCNDLVRDFFGFDKTKNISENYVNPSDRENLVSVLKRYGRVYNYLVKLKKDDRQVSAILNSVLLKNNSSSFILTTIHNLDGWLPHNLDQQSLIEKLEEKADALRQKDAAIKALQQQLNIAKQGLQDNVTENINTLVMPWLTKLQATGLNDRQQALLQELQNNLDDVFSSYTYDLSQLSRRLSPAELRVANLIRSGTTSKEIADMLGVAPRTIESHRRNIRKKLGLSNKKISLLAYLADLSS